MHRKKIRRWHKLLSVSGIIVAIFGMLYVPMANAVTSVPTVLGIYGNDFSSAQTQTEYVDFESDIVGLEVADFYFSGTATGCKVLSVPAVKAFSFSLQVGGCSEGSYFMHLKANSVAFENGVTGPTADFKGDPTQINRSPLSGTFENVPAQFDSTRMQWLFSTNQRIAPNPPYDFTVSGAGCFVAETGLVTTGMTIVVDGCKPGETVSLTINANALKSVYGNLGPVAAVASPAVPIVMPQAATPTPTVTPTASPTATPTASPTASPIPSVSPFAAPTEPPTPTPTASPSASAAPSDAPASVAVTIPPTDPPTPPVVVLQEPISPNVSDAEPVFAESEPSVSLAPIAITRSKIVQVRKEIAMPVVIAEPIPEQPAIADTPALPIAVPAIETSTPPSFNWQPIGYAAMVIGTAAGAVGGGILLQRITKVRRMKFS
jgi:hypothetical protein